MKTCNTKNTKNTRYTDFLKKYKKYNTIHYKYMYCMYSGHPCTAGWEKISTLSTATSWCCIKPMVVSLRKKDLKWSYSLEKRGEWIALYTFEPNDILTSTKHKEIFKETCIVDSILSFKPSHFLKSIQ